MNAANGRFNRWAICLATWHYAVAWHAGQWSDLYARQTRLRKLGFRVSPLTKEWPPSRDEPETRSLLAAWLWRDKPWRNR